MSSKVLPKDPKYHYSPEVAQGTHYNLVQCTMYSAVSAKVQPKNPKYPYSPEVPQGTHLNLEQYTR